VYDDSKIKDLKGWSPTSYCYLSLSLSSYSKKHSTVDDIRLYIIMGLSTSFSASFLLLLVLGLFVADGRLVPALFIFGDSIFDVGNNNNLFTIIKSNFPPYGRDFDTRLPTGRFCNGKLASDIVTGSFFFFLILPNSYFL
jgi:hypothetical protein